MQFGAGSLTPGEGGGGGGEAGGGGGGGAGAGAGASGGDVASEVSITSWGATVEPASRLDSRSSVLVVVVIAKLTAPSPVTNDVTLAEDHDPLAVLMPDAIIAPRGGAFAYVIVVSPQAVDGTERTLNPTELVFVERRRSVAFVTEPGSPETLKRVKLRRVGETSALRAVASEVRLRPPAVDVGVGRGGERFRGRGPGVGRGKHQDEEKE